MGLDLRIFLSSTYRDLVNVRSTVLKFLEVLRSDLVHMETFGSDESKPKAFCLEQVRNCNLFIGLLAERYGAVDPETQLSVTELEYLEALKLLEDGALLGLLVYIIHPKASWPIEHVDRDQIAVKKLEGFKERLQSRHTVTFFKSVEDLPFMVLRDVIRKVGLGTEGIFNLKPQPKVQRKRHLGRPIGMEYYTTDLAPFFCGRDAEIAELGTRVLQHRVSLLIGDSGIGKTSLINAGLLPQVGALGGRIAVTRPLTSPIANLRVGIWGQFFKGAPPPDFNIGAILRAVATACAPSTVLIVIDQFEDILGVRATADRDAICQALYEVYNASEENIRVLISYRGDVESRVGDIWKRVSGAPEGLPRTYLGPLSKAEAGQALVKNLMALKVTVEDRVLTGIVDDLETESLLSGFNGIYPPYLQMILSRARSDAGRRNVYTHKMYMESGRCKRIIADYLMNQLQYLGRQETLGRAVLIALVSSYGKKSQKNLREISSETMHASGDVQGALHALVDLRLVRAVNDEFEIVHDFLARAIASELVSTDEREAKKFKELLASRTAAYSDTRAMLTTAEHLHLFKYRSKILCTEQEARLLFASHLSGNGPVQHWLRGLPQETVIAWAKEFSDEESTDTQLNAYRFLIKSGVRFPLDRVAAAFSDYKLKNELGRYLLEVATRSDVELLLRLHRKKAEEVSVASEELLLRFVSLEDENTLERLSRSSHAGSKRLLERLALANAGKLGEAAVRAMLSSRKAWERRLAIFAAGADAVELPPSILEPFLKKPRLARGHREAAVKSIVRIAARTGEIELIRAQLRGAPKWRIAAALGALDRPVSGLKIKEALSCYKLCPWESAYAARQLASPATLSTLKKFLQSIALEPAARDVVLAICDHGQEAEFDFLLRLFLKADHEIRFWNAPVVLTAIAKLATKRKLPLLRSLVLSPEFWDYYPRKQRPRKCLPVQSFENVYFIKRLAAVAYANVAGRREMRVLRRMLFHSYWIVGNAAAEAICRLARREDLAGLTEDALRDREPSEAAVRVLCDLDERFCTS